MKILLVINVVSLGKKKQNKTKQKEDFPQWNFQF